MNDESLLQKMKALAIESKGHWRLICKTANVDYDWLCSVVQGRIEDPGVLRVERVVTAINTLSRQGKLKTRAAKPPTREVAQA
jgi:hypothetical protein